MKANFNIKNQRSIKKTARLLVFTIVSSIPFAAKAQWVELFECVGDYSRPSSIYGGEVCINLFKNRVTGIIFGIAQQGESPGGCNFVSRTSPEISPGLQLSFQVSEGKRGSSVYESTQSVSSTLEIGPESYVNYREAGYVGQFSSPELDKGKVIRVICTPPRGSG